MHTTVLTIDTADRRVVDVTDDAGRLCAQFGDGLLNVFAPHATAGLAIMETQSGSEHDLDELVARLLPRDDRYAHAHAHGAKGHGADHLLPVLVSPSLTVPVSDGRPLLGVWQRIVFVDYNADNPERQLRLSFLPG